MFYHGVSLVPPNFSTKKKTAKQPITAAVPINPVTKEGRDWNYVVLPALAEVKKLIDFLFKPTKLQS